MTLAGQLLFGVIIPILAIGFLVWGINQISKNPMAQTLFEKETLKALDSKDGKNHIREQAVLANKETFERAFKKLNSLEDTQKCHGEDINRIENSITRIDVNIEYIKKHIEKYRK